MVLELRSQTLDSLWSIDIDAMVVTASRSERKLSNVAVPTLVIPQKFISLSGTVRLNQLLQEQSGLFMTGSTGSSAIGGGVFGNGIQIQGMSPDYTMIMIDGEPIIGRQGGVMDLTRFTVGNIQKIEIVKGPSSALYGSEAMGGVINIITEQKRQNYLKSSVRYGSFNTKDIGFQGNYDHHKSTLYVFGNFNSSDGFDLNLETPEKSIDPNHNYTAQLKWTYRFNDKTKLIWSNRFFKGIQEGIFWINDNKTAIFGQGATHDYNLNPVLNHMFSESLKSSMRIYHSKYSYNQNLNYQSSGENYYQDDFNHTFSRIENQTDWQVNEKMEIIGGFGLNKQTVETNRYSQARIQDIGYLFLQSEYKPTSKITLIPGFRYDKNSDYADRFSPKVALQYAFDQNLKLNASYGAGFKAPDFRQLYLNYANPAAQGYRIYGTEEFSLKGLQDELGRGDLASILQDAYKITQLKPEVSNGFNLGANYAVKKYNLNTSINFFYNNITNLINYQPVAIQNNGSLVFSYLNIGKAFTQGIEINMNGKFKKNVEWSVGYQYLQTGDRAVLDMINANESFGRNSPKGETRLMKKSDYSGLIGRSPHMVNVKLQYDYKNDVKMSLRAIYRDAWGVVDIDGNKFANMQEEFAKSNLMLNWSMEKKLNKYFDVNLSVNNILQQIDPINMPQNPGRNFMLSMNIHLERVK